jgi:hypothetical protein
MKSTETSTSSAGRLQRGVLATLSGLLPFKGTPTPKIAKGPGARLALGVLFASLLFAAPALAAEAPTIVESTVKSSGETRETANLEAEVNPGGEEVSKCTFEYGTSTSYDQQQPCAQTPAEIGAGTEPVPVSAHLTGLNDNTEYHWRLTVTNAAGTTTTLDHTFVYSTEAGGLPDGRQYELVTPPEKDGADIGLSLFVPFQPQVGEDGARVVSFSLQCFAGSASCVPSHFSQAVPFEFARTSSGWLAHSLAPPTEGLGYAIPGPVGINPDPPEAGSSATAVFAISPSVSAFANGEFDWYVEKERDFAEIGPLAESSSGTRFIDVAKASELATADLQHFVYESNGSNTRPLWSFGPTLSPLEAVYEYEQGARDTSPRLVGLAPGSSGELASECGTHIGGENNYRYNALSEDGETVYFTAKPCKAGENGNQPPVEAFSLYARYEHARSELISAHAGEHPIAGEACDAACQAQPSSFANFEGASSDGSRVFFTDPHQLTDAASEDTSEISVEEGGQYCDDEQAPGATGCNLYESECPDRCMNPSERRLIDVSAGDTSGEAPRVLATVAISNDGSHVYFVARGALTGANLEGHTPVAGEPNLYVYDTETARTSFLATLSSADEALLWSNGSTRGLGEANVTPDGRFLVFLSHSALMPDTRTGAGAPPQAYRYDAATETLVRVSIGAQGFRDDGNEGVVGPKFDTTRIVRAGSSLERGVKPVRADPTMSDDGSRVFFESPLGLTPHALNDAVDGATEEGRPTYAENVYEWEQPGVGSCPAAQAAGCIYLISDGKDIAENDQIAGQTGKAVSLLGSDGSGANVFFTTSDQLVAQDTDTERDIYDAHICSSGEPCPPEAQATPPCLGEVCHGIPAEQQGAPTGGSLTLNGLGNITPAAPTVKPKAKPLTRAQKLANALKACKKDKRKAKRATCERQARAKYGPTKKKAKAKKSSNDRRATR